LAVQEIRWQGRGKIDKNNFTIFYGGTENRTGNYGTGFIISKRMKDNIINFEPINERISKLKIRGKY
jgi:hypothetical protein